MDRFLPLPLRSLLLRLEVNRAVGYLLLSRVWQVVSGLLTTVLLILCIDEKTSGNYQLFNGLLGMQMFVELGVPLVVMFVTTHEWAQLRFDDRGRIEGDAGALDRLAGLEHFITRWFWGCAAVFWVAMSMYGYFKIGESGQRRDLLAPWQALITVNAAALLLMPKISMLEGCNQFGTINAIRLPQSITGTIVVWYCLLMGCGLWTLAASNAVRWAWEFYLVRVRYREAFQSLHEHRVHQPISWFFELWPLSWRTAIQTVGSYFSTFYFVPLIDSFAGEIEVGRFGMTWTILMTIHAVALAWVNTRTAEYGAMALRAEHALLSRRLLKTGVISLTFFATGASAFVFAVWALRTAGIQQAERFLDLPSMGALSVGLAAVLIATLFQTSVRVYKKDLFLIANSVTSLLLAVLAWHWCHRWGSLGIGLAYATVGWAWTLPVSASLAWRHQRLLRMTSQTESVVST